MSEKTLEQDASTPTQEIATPQTVGTSKDEDMVREMMVLEAQQIAADREAYIGISVLLQSISFTSLPHDHGRWLGNRAQSLRRCEAGCV